MLASVLVASGCSLFTSLDDLDGDPVVETEGGVDGGVTPEASTPRTDGEAPRTDASDAAPASLVANAGFEEEGPVGCGPGWAAGIGSARRVSPGSGSPSACRVCNDTGYRDLFFVRSATAIDAGPGRWQVQFAGRVEADAGYKAPYFSWMLLRAKLADGGVATDSKKTTPDGTWQPTLGSIDAPPGTVGLELELGGDGETGSCYALDDVVVVPP